MRPPQLIHRRRIIQLNIQILVHALQYTLNLHLILKFDGNLVVDEGFEETTRLVSEVLQGRG